MEKEGVFLGGVGFDRSRPEKGEGPMEIGFGVSEVVSIFKESQQAP